MNRTGQVKKQLIYCNGVKKLKKLFHRKVKRQGLTSLESKHTHTHTHIGIYKHIQKELS